jgi:lipoprotein-anchoring transpeptidase ErfK/SrfK
MNRTSGLIKNLRQLGAAAILASVMLLSGQSGPHANAATMPPEGEGLVLVPPAKPVAMLMQKKASPAFKRGKIVEFKSEHAPGTIIVSARHKALFLVLGNGQAVKYRVATAKPGFEWKGTHKVSNKVKWPDWRPPTEMRKRRPDLPAFMAGGPDNPLGARAIYLGSSIYRIHGTNEPSSIGKAASSGCIRMLNADVEELYRNVKIGATVIVM